MKKFLIKAVLPVSMVVCAVAVASCSQDELLTQTKEQSEEGVLSNPREIRNYLKTLPLAPMMTRANGPITPNDGTPLPVEEEDPVVETQGVLDGIPGNWVKTTRHYKIKQTFDENFLFDPTSDVVYPGCVLKGGTIANGTYAMITSHKTGDVTFSISLSPADPSKAHETSATVPNIRKSEYQEVWNKWATMDWKESPVTTIQSVEKINSQEELVTKFESIDKDALDGYQPVYISSINYGRIIYLSIETDEKERNINEAIEFALNKIKGVDVNVSADQAVNYRKMLAKSDVHITVLGGGKTIQQEILKGDIDSFQRFLAADIPMEQMYPISFSLRYAVDNSQARVVSSSEFTVTQRDFVPVFKKVRMQLQVLGFSGQHSGPLPNLDKDANIWGKVMVGVNGQEHELVGIAQSNPFWFDYREKEETLHPIGFGGIVNVEFDKDKNESLEDFVDHQKISFITDLHTENGIYKYNYGRTQFNHTLGTVFSKYKSDNPVVVLESNYKHIKIHTYVKILDLKFFN